MWFVVKKLIEGDTNYNTRRLICGSLTRKERRATYNETPPIKYFPSNQYYCIFYVAIDIFTDNKAPSKGEEDDNQTWYKLLGVIHPSLEAKLQFIVAIPTGRYLRRRSCMTDASQNRYQHCCKAMKVMARQRDVISFPSAYEKLGPAHSFAFFVVRSRHGGQWIKEWVQVIIKSLFRI